AWSAALVVRVAGGGPAGMRGATPRQRRERRANLGRMRGKPLRIEQQAVIELFDQLVEQRKRKRLTVALEKGELDIAPVPCSIEELHDRERDRRQERQGPRHTRRTADSPKKAPLAL